MSDNESLGDPPLPPVQAAPAPVPQQAVQPSAITTPEQAIAEVRNAQGSILWACLELQEGGVLALAGCGSSMDAIGAALQPASVAYVLVRVLVDEDKGHLERAIGRLKFAMVSWVGDQVSPAKRGDALHFASKVEESVGSVHVNIKASEASHVTAAEIVARVKLASGAFYDSGGHKDQSHESESQGRQEIRSEGISKPKGRGKGTRRMVGRGAKKLDDDE